MPEAVIVNAVRTPIGRHGGVLKDVRPDDLAALVLKEIAARAALDPALVEEVYLGCANQAGEDNRNVARMATLLAGFPVSVAAVTFNRLCASGLTAVNAAARANGLTYSRFAEGLKAAGIGLDRKILADLAVTDENTFKSIVDQAKSALEDKSKSKKKAA